MVHARVELSLDRLEFQVCEGKGIVKDLVTFFFTLGLQTQMGSWHCLTQPPCWQLANSLCITLQQALNLVSQYSPKHLHDSEQSAVEQSGALPKLT